MRRSSSAVVVEISWVHSFAHFATTKNTRSRATGSILQSISPLCTCSLSCGYSVYSLCKQGWVRKVQMGELKECERREDGGYLRGRDGSRPRVVYSVVTVAISVITSWRHDSLTPWRCDGFCRYRDGPRSYFTRTRFYFIQTRICWMNDVHVGWHVSKSKWNLGNFTSHLVRSESDPPSPIPSPIPNPTPNPTSPVWPPSLTSQSDPQSDPQFDLPSPTPPVQPPVRPPQSNPPRSTPSPTPVRPHSRPSPTPFPPSPTPVPTQSDPVPAPVRLRSTQSDPVPPARPRSPQSNPIPPNPTPFPTNPTPFPASPIPFPPSPTPFSPSPTLFPTIRPRSPCPTPFATSDGFNLVGEIDGLALNTSYSM